MEKLTYKQAFDLITEAYIKGEIKPDDPRFCFCGTLCGGDAWYSIMGRHAENGVVRIKTEHKKYAGYTGIEFGLMEYALLKEMWNFNTEWDGYEDALFLGMSAALDVLRQIHIERGEVIDESPVFTKRQLA